MKRKLQILYTWLLRYVLRRKQISILDGPLKGKKWLLEVPDNSCILGCYEEENVKEVIKYSKPGQVIYDIGANAGYFSLLFSSLVSDSGRVISFEALPRNCDILKDHLNLNRLSNIKLVEGCVSDHEGEIEFSDHPNPVVNTYLSRSPVFAGSKKITVPCHSLDALIGSLSIPPADIIKIDVEGAEYDVLKGAAELLHKYRPVILLALHDNHNPGVSSRCIEFLRSQNYRVVTTRKDEKNKMEDLIALPE